MTERKLPLFRLLLLVVLLAATGVSLGWLVAREYYGWFSPALILLIYLSWRLVNVYRGIVRNLDFIFGAVRNNDFSFRFVDNPLRTEHAVVNYSLNRIKEVLDEAKVKAAEKEKYFETIIECANIGIVIMLENGTVIKHNSKAANMLGVQMLSHAERLRQISPALADAMLSIVPMEQRSICFSTETGEITLLLNCSPMKYNGRKLRVVSIENINRELDTQEGLAWEKLTRIMTHEIMNSLAPVVSISHTLLHGNEDAVVLQQGLETIHSTSDRLMQFVDSFRAVTRIPLPEKAPFYVADLFNEAVTLISFNDTSLKINVVPEDIMVYADRKQMLQVVVNLLKNAIEACASSCGERKIELSSHIAPDEKVHIEVSNNGGAIPQDVAENIFTPFFTTKQNGSGIGLAVSKQIIRLHGGSLSLTHNRNDRVTFLIVVD
ncbi:MAG: GHKL domain-containing protein [Bacteroidaceae bacterium]|nr:GHKL domain-containing protein [Bacteroidaceae bacterium]